MLGSNYPRLRIWRICWIPVMNVGSNLVYICLGAYHPVDGKIHKILPLDFLQGDAISSPVLALSVTFPKILSDPPITSSPARK
jgi:hypothetical protein